MKRLSVFKKSISILSAVVLAAGLVACGSQTAESTQEASTEQSDFQVSEAQEEASTEEVEEPVAKEIDKDAFDSLVSSGIVADYADIAASEWASKVKEAGVLRVGAVRTSFLFSQLDETDNSVRGFDAGLFQLLRRLSADKQQRAHRQRPEFFGNLLREQRMHHVRLLKIGGHLCA